MNAADTWGNPGLNELEASRFRAANIVKITVGPFPAAGALKKPHPAVSFSVHREAALVFQCFLTEIIRDLGYRLDGQADDWGYIWRPIRGYEKQWAKTHDLRYLSNHGRGTAIDINSATNPMTRNGRLITDMPKAVIDCARRWRITWGGHYQPPRLDPMHYEITAPLAEIKAFTGDLRKLFAALAKAA